MSGCPQRCLSRTALPYSGVRWRQPGVGGAGGLTSVRRRRNYRARLYNAELVWRQRQEQQQRRHGRRGGDVPAVEDPQDHHAGGPPSASAGPRGLPLSRVSHPLGSSTCGVPYPPSGITYPAGSPTHLPGSLPAGVPHPPGGHLSSGVLHPSSGVPYLPGGVAYLRGHPPAGVPYSVGFHAHLSSGVLYLPGLPTQWGPPATYSARSLAHPLGSPTCGCGVTYPAGSPT